MDQLYDLTKEEIEIFHAESQEQIQILDEGLVQLEQDDDYSQLIQELFRAAHTLKGSAGMIGHREMVDLTHGLETALDGVRKDKVIITAELIDICLKAVDVLRLYIEELAGGPKADIDATDLVAQFLAVSDSDGKKQKKKPQTQPIRVQDNTNGSKNGQYTSISVDIDQESIAPAARALQVIMELQEHGEIISSTPDQESIESAAPVENLVIQYHPNITAEEIQAAVSNIPEVFNIHIEVVDKEAPPPDEITDEGIDLEDNMLSSDDIVPRSGEFLVKNGYILQEQLDSALKAQKESGENEPNLIGQVLVKKGFISQALLDEALAILYTEMRDQLRKPKAPAVDQPRSRGLEKTIRASVERLDDLMNHVGELITDRNRLIQIRSVFEDEYYGNESVDKLSETIAHLGRITDQLQSGVMGLRMQPISNVFNKYPRLVRDLSRKAGKKIELTMEGQDTELDRSVIEVISDPLIHLMRNAVDHGIETPEDRVKAGKPEIGSIHLKAHHEQGQIIITIKDDGHGIDIQRIKEKAVSRGTISENDAAAMTDKEAVDLIFESGLSTAQKVSEISGRGVGMDIVRANIEGLNGAISIDTWPGNGTQFRISLPLTLAVVPTLLVQSGSNTFAIPLITVTETLRIPSTDIKSIKGKPAILLRGQILPLAHLRRVLGYPDTKNNYQHYWIVAVRSGNSQLGLIVDKLLQEEEVMIKSLGLLTGKISGVTGAAILGDGQIALVLEISRIMKMAIINH